ncbi:MAG: hypothetical protein IT457_15895 [Planctomycetes bacterium]|nr:hypothetical protein [Planctomycetota bacterium]
MKTNHILQAALLWASSVCAVAQEPTGAAPALQNVTDLSADYAHVQREPSGLYGLGRDYTVRFQSDSVEFVPHLPSAPVEQPLVLRTASFGRGTARLPAPAAQGPRESGRSVHYERHALTEVYEVRPDGLKQSFVFEQLPSGEGDLVVEVELESALPLDEADGDAVRFRNEHGEVRIAGVLGIDARGDTTPGSLAYADGVLSLRLPAAFVERAALPLVLDPVINTSTLGSSSIVTRVISAAYDASSAAYLVVWGASISTEATELRGQFVPGGPVLIETSAPNRYLDVANNNASNCFVVTWNVLRPGGSILPMPYEVLRVRVLRPGNNGTAIDLPGQGIGVSNSRAAVGSNASPTDNRLLMMFQSANPLAPTVRTARLRTLTVGSDLSISGSPTTDLATPAGLTATYASIARTADSEGRYLSAFAEQIAQYDHQISFQVFDVGRSIHSNLVTLVLDGPDQFGHISIDGASPLWVVNGARQNVGYSGDRGIPRIYRCEFDPARRDLRAYLGVSLTNSADAQDIAATGRTVMVCWDYNLANLTGQQCVTCSTETIEFFGSLRSTFARPAANGDTRAASADLVKVFWGRSSGTNTIQMGDYVPGDGIATELGGGCGTFTARVNWSCARRGGTQFESVLENPPVDEAWLMIGLDRLDSRGCGTCTLVPNPWTALVFSPRSAPARGTRVHTLTIPDSPHLLGLRLYQQWLVVDRAAPGCATLQFSLSNALQIEIQ